MDKAGLEDWYSLQWLQMDTLQSYDWNYPMFLYLILLVPIILLLRLLILRQVRQKLEIALPEGKARRSESAFLRFIPPIFMILAVIFILVALARPQKTNERVDRNTEGIDIMIVLDISESMQIEDFVPNRLEAAKQVAKDFISGRFQDRIGIVIFSGEAISYSPLTTDYDMLNSLIDDIDFRMIGKGGTAIGSAIGVSLNRFKESTSKSKVLILLSDGDNNAGSINPITAAGLAKDYGIKIYSIGIGKEGRVPYGTDIFGNRRYIEESLDETTLRQVSEIADGMFFRATDNKALNEIFDIIDEYEKVEIIETHYKDTKDYYFIYLMYGIISFLAWLGLKSTFMVNALED